MPGQGRVLREWLLSPTTTGGLGGRRQHRPLPRQRGPKQCAFVPSVGGLSRCVALARSPGLILHAGMGGMPRRPRGPRGLGNPTDQGVRPPRDSHSEEKLTRAQRPHSGLLGHTAQGHQSHPTPGTPAPEGPQLMTDPEYPSLSSLPAQEGGLSQSVPSISERPPSAAWAEQC